MKFGSLLVYAAAILPCASAARNSTSPRASRHTSYVSTLPSSRRTVLSSSRSTDYAHPSEIESRIYTTVISTAYTTYCPSPTVIPVGNITYTVTKPTTLTISNCPCTVVKTGIPPVKTKKYSASTSSSRTPSSSNLSTHHPRPSKSKAIYTTVISTAYTTYCPVGHCRKRYYRAVS
ncbi:hypothetical protein JDV02_005586 [Purpureocillium takamizusanense]|uniref:Uncharacterized protein n=1 Tax=Purpureocillium takamizusanense TaxID=2060973 RepID=A0A9Q8VBX4_9HYPO|nr:uncharacterized protein JDV02_005586 [Purpureocillium takamizusanense]UNI19401.1 hypothetical protein JDV02_005586 [Purpureocillium takamizusanense]